MGLRLPEFKEAWLDYCRCFNASKTEQAARYGQNFGTLLLFHTTLAQRAWAKFDKSDGYTGAMVWDKTPVQGSAALEPGYEHLWISTNTTALYGLAAIQNLALVGDHLPA